MTNPESYLSFHEIILTLLGEKGVNTLKGLPPKNVSLTPEGIGWFNDPTLPSRRQIPYDELEDDENRRKTQLRIIEVIEEAIHNGGIKSPDDLGTRGIDTLEFRVQYDSFFLWFQNNPKQLKKILVLLESVDRSFPKSWDEIINVAGKIKLSLQAKEQEIEGDQKTKIKDISDQDIENSFKSDGQDNWRIMFGKKKLGLVKDSDGMRYISILLNENKAFSSEVLYGFCQAREEYKGGGISENFMAEVNSQKQLSGIAPQHPGQEILDSDYLKSLMAEIERLNERIAEIKASNYLGNKYLEDELEKNEQELHSHKEFLRKNTKPDQKTRKVVSTEFASEAKRAGQKIHHALNTAYRNIEEESSELARHLKDSIKRENNQFSYKPPEGEFISWEVVLK
ncbi:hypothetical protein N9L33_04350 [Nitrospinae bacterium]|nr:hypothetical protein [Nitrospinota bacterium]